jgi:hypothetical protein
VDIASNDTQNNSKPAGIPFQMHITIPGGDLNE